MELIRDRDANKVKAVMDAMMTMVKLDVAALERAHDEAPEYHTPHQGVRPSQASHRQKTEGTIA